MMSPGIASLSQLSEMYQPAKFGGQRSCRNGDINSYINSYLNASEKVWTHHLDPPVQRFSKSVIQITGNCKALNAFQANTIIASLF